MAVLWLGCAPAATAQEGVCYGRDYGPTTRTPIDATRWNCVDPSDPCCLDPRFGDADADGDTVPARCDPDDANPDDDGDGLPTALEDLDGDGWLFGDTDRRSPTGAATPAFLDPTSPLDDDEDGFCDCAWAPLADPLPAFCASADDCMDFLRTAFPGAPEVYDPELWDHDCGGANDLDLDGDGFLASSRVETGLDCDDLDSSIHPGVAEDPGPADRDCDGFYDPALGLRPSGGCGCAGLPDPAAGLLGLPLVGWAAARGGRRRR